MRLTRIAADNLKGRSFAYDLAPLQLILGANFKGKTAIIEGIRLALLGYIPEIGKRAQSTWELSSHSALRVYAAFDTTDKTIERKWWLAGQKLTYDSNTTEALDAKMDELPLLNSEYYFSLTDKQRVDYVFSKINLPESYTPEAITARLQQISFGAEHSEEVEKAKQRAIASVQSLICKTGTRLADTLTESRETLALEFTYRNKREKETQGAVAILTELKNRSQEATPDKVKQLDEFISAKHAAINEINRKLGAARQEVAAWEKLKIEREKIEATLATAAPDHSGVIATLLGRVRELRPVVEAMPKSTNEIVDRVVSLREQRNALQSRLINQRKAIEDAKHELAQLAKMPFCPFCKSKSKDWRKELDTYYTKVIADATPQEIALKAELNKVEIELTEAEAERERQQMLFSKGEDARIKALELAHKAQLLETEQKSVRANRAELEERFKALPALGERLDPAKIEAEMSKLAGEAGELSQKRTEAIKLQHDLKRAAEAAMEHDTAAAHVKVIKAIGKELVAIQAEMIDAVFGGLLKIANQFVEGIFQSPLAFHENTVGRWNGSKFIPHSVFSGTEKALTYIAVAAALSSQAPLKLLILDEIGRLDRENQTKVLARLAAAVENKIVDQVIVAGTESQAGEEWSVIRL